MGGAAANDTMEHYTDVSWDQTHGDTSTVSGPGSESEGGLDGRKGSNTTTQPGRTADMMDLAGVGDAKMECSVTSPIKENDGTKDAYVSYLVTTHVRTSFSIPSPY